MALKNSLIYPGESVYCTCSTAAATAAKTAAYDGFVLQTGTIVYVNFTNWNTATTPTLNIESTGAKSIIDNYGQATSKIHSGLNIFIYDGSSWRIQSKNEDCSIWSPWETILSSSKNITTATSTTYFNFTSAQKTRINKIESDYNFVQFKMTFKLTFKGTAPVPGALSLNMNIRDRFCNYYFTNEWGIHVGSGTSAGSINIATGETTTLVNNTTTSQIFQHFLIHDSWLTEYGGSSGTGFIVHQGQPSVNRSIDCQHLSNYDSNNNLLMWVNQHGLENYGTLTASVTTQIRYK